MEALDVIVAAAKDHGPWWLLPVVLLIGMFAKRKPAAPAPSDDDGEWLWPMPRLPDGRRPEVSDGYGVRRSGKLHEGVDIMYRRPINLPGRPKLPLPDHGSRGYEVPAGTPVLAAADGAIWSTGEGPRGHYIVIDHGQPTGRSTYYQHLDRLAVPSHSRGKRSNGSAGLEVRRGEVIGYVGYSSEDPGQIRHLHFEVRQGRTAINPSAIMKGWGYVD